MMIPTTLPVDSNERKEIPVVTGALLYFPAAVLSVERFHDGSGGVIQTLARTLEFVAAYQRGCVTAKRDALDAAADLCSAALRLSQTLHERFANAPVPYTGDDAWSLYPAALAGVARISVAGNKKHNPGEPLHHARGKSTDHADCIGRHLMDVNDLLAAHQREDKVLNTGTLCKLAADILTEVSALCWRALALTQQLHEDYGAPLAPAARLPEPTVDAKNPPLPETIAKQRRTEVALTRLSEMAKSLPASTCANPIDHAHCARVSMHSGQCCALEDFPNRCNSQYGCILEFDHSGLCQALHIGGSAYSPLGSGKGL